MKSENAWEYSMGWNKGRRNGGNLDRAIEECVRAGYRKPGKAADAWVAGYLDGAQSHRYEARDSRRAS